MLPNDFLGGSGAGSESELIIQVRIRSTAYVVLYCSGYRNRGILLTENFQTFVAVILLIFAH